MGVVVDRPPLSRPLQAISSVTRRYFLAPEMTSYKCVRFDEVEDILKEWYLNDSENDTHHKQTEESPSKFDR